MIKSINTRKPMAFRSLLDATAPLPANSLSANCKRLNNSFISAVYEYRAKVRLGLLTKRKCVTVNNAIKS